MNTQYLKISVFTLYLLLVLGVSVSVGALSQEYKSARANPLKAKEMLYRISTNDLESLKNSLVNINLHMRKDAGKTKPEIKIIIHGHAAKFLYKKSMDSELKYMVDWFMAENVGFAICEVCKETFNIDMNALPEGFVLAGSE